MGRVIAKSVAIVVAVISVAVVLVPRVVLAQGNPEQGKGLYAKHCGGCHGPSGKGDGPAAAVLNPKPTDMTNKAYMAGLKDQYLLDLIKKGGAAVGKSPLIPAFGSKLNDGEIRDVIAYIKSLAK